MRSSLPRTTALSGAADQLSDVWGKLHLEDVVQIDPPSLARNLLAWGAKLVSGGAQAAPRVHGLVDTAPLRRLLERLLPKDEAGEIAGLTENLARCQPEAVAVTTLDYTTGQTMTWAAGCDIEMWERPLRRSVRARLTIDHVLASASLPIIFPAVRLGAHWHGDGGIRLSAPLSPALHLGADRILAISTHYAKSFAEADEPQVIGYPPPAQILGQLMDAIFLDAMDEDAARLERANAFLRELPAEQRHGYHPGGLRRRSSLAGFGPACRRVRAGAAAGVPLPDPQPRHAGDFQRRLPEPAHVSPRIPRTSHRDGRGRH